MDLRHPHEDLIFALPQRNCTDAVITERYIQTHMNVNTYKQTTLCNFVCDFFSFHSSILNFAGAALPIRSTSSSRLTPTSAHMSLVALVVVAAAATVVGGLSLLRTHTHTHTSVNIYEHMQECIGKFCGKFQMPTGNIFISLFKCQSVSVLLCVRFVPR